MPAVRGRSSPASTTRWATSARASSIGRVLSTFDGHEGDGQVEVAAAVLGLELLDEQALVEPAVLGEAGRRPRGSTTVAVDRALAVPGQRGDAGRRRVGVDGAHLVAGAGRDAAHRLAVAAAACDAAAGAACDWCQSSTTSPLSTRKTPSADRQSPTGSRSRSKWACHTGLSSRAWKSTDEATRATACCSAVRSCGLMPTRRSRRSVSRRMRARRWSEGVWAGAGSTAPTSRAPSTGRRAPAAPWASSQSRSSHVETQSSRL